MGLYARLKRNRTSSSSSSDPSLCTATLWSRGRRAVWLRGDATVTGSAGGVDVAMLVTVDPDRPGEDSDTTIAAAAGRAEGPDGEAVVAGADGGATVAGASSSSRQRSGLIIALRPMTQRDEVRPRGYEDEVEGSGTHRVSATRSSLRWRSLHAVSNSPTETTR